MPAYILGSGLIVVSFVAIVRTALLTVRNCNYVYSKDCIDDSIIAIVRTALLKV